MSNVNFKMSVLKTANFVLALGVNMEATYSMDKVQDQDQNNSLLPITIRNKNVNVNDINIPNEIWDVIFKWTDFRSIVKGLRPTCTLFYHMAPLAVYSIPPYHMYKCKVEYKLPYLFPNLIDLDLSLLPQKDKNDERTINDDSLMLLTKLGRLNMATHNTKLNRLITDKSLLRLSNLTELNLTGIKTLHHLGSLTKLQKLTVCYFCPDEMERTGINFLTNLTDLDVSIATIKAKTLRPLSNLKRLNLRGTHTNASITYLTNLTDLNLSHSWGISSNLGDVSIQKLTNLTRLNLKYNRYISNKGIQNLTKLVGLNLEENIMITNNGIKNLINLGELNIASNRKITDEGVKNLTNLTKLHRLYTASWESIDYRNTWEIW